MNSEKKPTMLSREAELFEKANIVDIGAQHMEAAMEALSLDSHKHDEYSHDNEYNEESEGVMNIDEVEAVDHAHAAEAGLVDNNLVVDEAYSHSLSERASQFISHDGKGSSFPEVPKPVVDYTRSDSVNLARELDEWFSANEIEQLGQLKNDLQRTIGDRDFHKMSIDMKEALVESLMNGLSTDKYEQALTSLLFIALGEPNQVKSNFEDHVQLIKRNTLFLVRSGIALQLIPLFKRLFALASTIRLGLSSASKCLFHCCTILYCITLVFLDNDSSEDDEVSDLKRTLDQQQMLQFLVKCTDDWRWNTRISMRIRNIITLLSKLIQFQIGGLEKRQLAKKFVCEKVGVTREKDSNKLMASPIDFHLFREDIIARYPTYVPPSSKIPEDFENPSSLSQFITIPRSQKRSTHNGIGESSPPEIHIATPAPSPSPPASPMNRSIKAKRIFRTRDGFPLIYPLQDNEALIPESIKEASELFASRVQEKLSLKQLWAERDNFVKQEKGWLDSTDSLTDAYDYYSWDDNDHQEQLDSLRRVEDLYRDSLGHLASLVHVCVQLIVSSQGSLNPLLKGSLDESDLDILRSKEVLLKNATTTLYLLLKWFKANHVLKFEYLGTLMYDSNFFFVVVQYLNTIDTKLLDRINRTDVYEPVRSMWLDTQRDAIIDKNFCCSFANLLDITSMICQRKTQRILSISELNPAPAFKNILSLRNATFWSPVLKIIKQITSFNGKKWKANNMDLISMVYIHSKLDLKDNWLCGRDIDSEIADAYGQEIALRALVQFYNSRKYIDTMNQLGYAKKPGDFFTREIELLASDS